MRFDETSDAPSARPFGDQCASALDRAMGGLARRPRVTLALLAALLLAVAWVVIRYRWLASPAGPAPADWSMDAPTGPPIDVGKARANPAFPVERGPFRFAEIARQAGIDFIHVSGMTEAKHFPTAYGSGVAVFDCDGDGKMDLYFASATFLPLGTRKTGPNRLYRNLGGLRFEDVTERSGLGFQGYCQGIVVGDIDNDGAPDVFLCNYGTNALYRNKRDGTFEEIGRSAGVARAGWSTAGAFLDYDNDGDLDLYVANYGDWKLPENDQYCRGTPPPFVKDAPRIRIYCSPRSVPPARHCLYRNNGDLTFTEVAAEAGLVREDGRGLGVVAADLNGDGRVDLYVANDMCPNFVYLNRGDGTFEDATSTSGAGHGESGQVRAGMGVDVADLDGDGRPEIFVTNYWNEPNSLFHNRGDGLFEERSRTSGMLHDGWAWVGWGCALADFDNDGWPDCFVANGQIDDNLESIGLNNPYAEPALLHRNVDGKRFVLATRGAGPYFDDEDHVGRGAAYGDLDDDGDIDLVVNHKDGPPALLRNDTPTKNHWLRLRLIGTRSNRDAVGARIEVEAGGRTFARQRKGGASYASAHDPRPLIGLGRAQRADRVTIRWPSGIVDEHRNVPADAELVVREGGR